MAWKNVQYKNGKYQTSSGGGGGASNLSDLDDTNISSPTNGQVLKYNGTSSKWENANESGGSGHSYSTTEQVVGTWIDGKPLYEKTVSMGALSYGNSWNTVSHGISNFKQAISIQGIVCSSNDGIYYSIPAFRPAQTNGITIGIDSTNVRYLNYWISNGTSDCYVIVRYTKTTD